MTAKEVLAKMGWSGARLTRMERAETVELAVQDVDHLSEVLRFPAEFFTTAPVSRVEPSDLSFRAPKAMTAAEKNRMAQVMALSGDFLLQLHAAQKLPPLLIEPRPTLDPVAAAAAAREMLNVGPDAPIADLTHLMERSGIPVMMRSERFGSQGLEGNSRGRLEKHLGCSVWIGEFRERPLVASRELDSWERTRWTLAHELGHLMLHRNAGEMTDEREQEASRFASEFLAPYAHASASLRSAPSLVNLLPVKMKWGISLGALLRHFYESGAMDEHRYETLRKQLYTRVNPDTGFTWGRTEPGWDDRLPERPRLMSRWVEAVYGTKSVQALAARRLILPVDVIGELMVGQRGPAQKAVATPASAAAPSVTGRRGAVVEVDFAGAHRSRQA
ncbi:MAG: ImmA/IrrE family metallo-endopeptidase [Gordonia sp. (in: high G+C Gram-positive bacteria)]|nr:MULTISPECIES: ImmA/IrrE family metallo-endopeptidase [Gordonia]WFN92522.1 ImmA/IrrE family metallo-endopeptidase [Gordonia sihwensis]